MSHIFEFKGRWYRRLYPYTCEPRLHGWRIISLGALSGHAITLYKRLLEGYYYRPYSDNTPKAMQELIDHRQARRTYPAIQG